MYCKSCGTQIRGEANYCFNCGKPIHGEKPIEHKPSQEPDYTERKVEYAQRDLGTPPLKRLDPRALNQHEIKLKKASGRRLFFKVLSFMVWSIVFLVLGFWSFLLIKGVELDSISKIKNYYFFATKYGYYLKNSSSYQVDGVVEKAITQAGTGVEYAVRTFSNEIITVKIDPSNPEKVSLFKDGSESIIESNFNADAIPIGTHVGIFGTYIGCGAMIGKCFKPNRIYLLHP